LNLLSKLVIIGLVILLGFAALVLGVILIALMPVVEDGTFEALDGIAVDSQDNVYVTDFILDRTQKFNNTGGFITKWKSGGGASMLILMIISM
jgi:hypothetical protein